MRPQLLLAWILLVGCGGAEAAGGAGQGPGTAGAGGGTAGAGGGEGGTCALVEHTRPSGTVAPSGCAVLDRDASACAAERRALGLDGAWLRFSCRVVLAVAGDHVELTSDGQPDHRSFYFPAGSACYEDFPEGLANPNRIAVQRLVTRVRRTPDTSSTTMRGTPVVGVALNGVPIYANVAAPGDDIYREALTFDRCAAHPQRAGQYHYHAEPWALTYDDARLVGLLRDGYPVYGRRDPDGSTPELDAHGGHTGPTADSGGAAVYHYHVNEQTSTSPGTLGERQWFLTRGTFRGSP